MVVSKVLIIGATGYIGRYVAKASIKLGHPTFLLVRSTSPSDPAKAELLKSLKDAGATLLVGDVADHASLVAALKQVDVVISVVRDALDQLKMIDAIKEVGTIKRFLPSEYGGDAERMQTYGLPILETPFGQKVTVRRAIEASGIPYTYVCSGCFAGYYLAPILQDSRTPPRDGKLIIFGDGNAKAILNAEEDIGTFTVKSIDDPRTENKILHIRAKENVASQNELTAIWEEKIGHKFEKETLDKESVFKSVNELPFPHNLMRALKYVNFVNGEMTSYALDASKDVEATELYPDVSYTTIDAYLSKLV